METKKFDCVEMKRKGSEAVYKKVANLTKTEQLKFWRDGNEELRKIIKGLTLKGNITKDA